jgi:hypothetical protein
MSLIPRCSWTLRSAAGIRDALLHNPVIRIFPDGGLLGCALAAYRTLLSNVSCLNQFTFPVILLCCTRLGALQPPSLD